MAVTVAVAVGAAGVGAPGVVGVAVGVGVTCVIESTVTAAVPVRPENVALIATVTGLPVLLAPAFAMPALG